MPDSNLLLRSFLEYDFWANLEVLKSRETLRKARKDTELLDKSYAHILEVKRNRLAQVEEKSIEDLALAIEPHSPALFEDATRELYERYSDFLERRSDCGGDRLDAEITYHNADGEAFSQTVTEMIFHVLNHGTYHRGQIALYIRAADGVPAPADYLIFVHQKNGQYV